METNNLIYKTNKVIGNEHIFVTIRLNDECKNGHQDFAITGDIYEANKPKKDKYFISGGCIHEDILKHFPEFKIFIDLHLCDYKGIPMHAAENGFYYLKNGFNNNPVNSDEFINKFCKYYRISKKQFNALKNSENVLQYSILLLKLGVLKQWEKQASKAIKLLEQLTGNEFLIDSVKTQFKTPSEDEIKTEEDLIKSGYYSDENKKERELKKGLDFIAKIEEERKNKINSINLEFDTKIELLKNAGKKFYDNCIFYSHTKTLCFNWRGYDKLNKDEIENSLKNCKFDDTIKIEIK